MDSPDYEDYKDSLRYKASTEFAHAVTAASEPYPTGAQPAPFLPEPQKLKVYK